jgi:hypothetical protein
VPGDRSRATGQATVPELPRALVARAGATRHVVVLELSCARRRESGPRARGGREAAASPGGGSWSHEAHGGSGATLC